MIWNENITSTGILKRNGKIVNNNATTTETYNSILLRLNLYLHIATDKNRIVQKKPEFQHINGTEIIKIFSIVLFLIFNILS